MGQGFTAPFLTSYTGQGFTAPFLTSYTGQGFTAPFLTSYTARGEVRVLTKKDVVYVVELD